MPPPLRQNGRTGVRSVKAVVGILAVLLAAFLISGCAVTSDTEFGRIVPRAEPAPWRLAVLPPRIDSVLRPENLKPESSWYARLLDGRGGVVGSAEPEKDVAMLLGVTLARSRFCQGIGPAASPEDAIARGADHLLICTVHDFRTILRGGNARYAWVVLLGPLVPQYWIRCLTLEARLDWEVEIVDIRNGRREFYRRHSRSYYKTVRYAFPSYFQDKMLNFLRFEATPEFVGELFMLDLREPEPPAK